MNISNWQLTFLPLSILGSNILAVIVPSLVALLVISAAFFLALRELVKVHDSVLKVAKYQKSLVFPRVLKAKNEG